MATKYTPKKKKSSNVIEPMDEKNTSIMDNYKKTNEIVNYLNKEAKKNASSE